MTYLHEPFQTLKPLSQCDMLRGKQKRNLTFFVYTYTSVIIDCLKRHPVMSACTVQNTEVVSSKKTLMQVLVIMRYLSNTNSILQRLRFVSLTEMTDCHRCSPSSSTLQSHIIRHLNQTYISIKAQENCVLRLAHRRCVPLLSS